ncbi:MAG: hypothetical protein KAI24_10655 [Planctomycetes bacterium]|nr:hypothetical protein [Planctomycetota bacterium]
MKKGMFLFGALLLCLLSTSCTIGKARDLDIKKDLTGLDLHYLNATAADVSQENSQSVDGQLSGWPFWFAPLGTVRFSGTNALHRGEVGEVENNRATAPISGFEHNRGSALGLGLLTYNLRKGEWTADGDLERWESTHGLGWGVVYSQKTWGDTTGRSGSSTKILFGLLGYSGDDKEGFLHLLWIPIPWK